MCLYVNKETTEALRKRMRDAGGSIAVWKFYKVYGGFIFAKPQLKSPYQDFYVSDPGVVRCYPPVLPELSADERCTVNYGIHVFTEQADAERAAAGNVDYVVVELIAREEHLRAAGTFNRNGALNAVFTQVEITPEEFKRVTKRLTKAKCEVGETVRLRSGGAFPGGEVEITEITECSVKFKRAGVKWDCGIEFFRKELMR